MEDKTVFLTEGWLSDIQDAIEEYETKIAMDFSVERYYKGIAEGLRKALGILDNYI